VTLAQGLLACKRNLLCRTKYIDCLLAVAEAAQVFRENFPVKGDQRANKNKARKQ
jgi:hypothetical protein